MGMYCNGMFSVCVFLLGCLPLAMGFLFDPKGIPGIPIQGIPAYTPVDIRQYYHPPTTKKPDSVFCGDKLCHHGNCNMLTFPWSCNCESGWEGITCEVQTLPNIACYTLHHPCDHGRCLVDHAIKYSNNYYCKCDHGYSGPSCADQITLWPQTAPTTLPKTQAPTTAKTTPITTTTTTSTSSPTTPITTTTTTSTSSPTTPTTTHTTTPTTSTMTTTTQSTSTSLISFYDCESVNTVLDIGNKIPQTNPNVTRCTSGSDATPEAFVMNLCNTPLPPSWKQGMNVMQHCGSIPMYTPVASFSNQRYNTTGGFSGIFLGCLPNGFKLGAQPCDEAPQILHLETGGVYTMDPDQYYTVM